MGASTSYMDGDTIVGLIKEILNRLEDHYTDQVPLITVMPFTWYENDRERFAKWTKWTYFTGTREFHRIENQKLFEMLRSVRLRYADTTPDDKQDDIIYDGIKMSIVGVDVKSFFEAYPNEQNKCVYWYRCDHGPPYKFSDTLIYTLTGEGFITTKSPESQESSPLDCNDCKHHRGCIMQSKSYAHIRYGRSGSSSNASSNTDFSPLLDSSPGSGDSRPASRGSRSDRGSVRPLGDSRSGSRRSRTSRSSRRS